MHTGYGEGINIPLYVIQGIKGMHNVYRVWIRYKYTT